MSSSLDGKTALVTEAGRGLGRAIAMGLASAGGTVALVARSAGELAGTARRVHELGGAPLVISSDLGEDPARIGTALHNRFSRSYEAGILITPEHSAHSLLARLDSDASGQTWDVANAA
jgi:NAD(P)-dependent dehydrogenase (short-subunit alcohol dehydrogenase family)